MNVQNNSDEMRIVSILDGLNEGVQIIDYDWRYVYVNETVAKQGKSTREQLLGNSMMACYPGIENTELYGEMQEVMFKRNSKKIENEFKFPDASTGWFELRIEPISEGILIISIDITERKKAELKLKAIKGELEEDIAQRDEEIHRIEGENQALVKELHHRVKNNLQIISSLLSLQMNKEDDDRVINRLRISRDRIHTISLIHESLYRRDSLAGIEVKNYMKDLLVNHVESYRGITCEIDYEVNCPKVYIEINTMLPVGMLLNELISNSLKHAFAGKNRGKISISFKKQKGRYALNYMDDGNGFDDGKVEKGSGHLLIEGFIEQINGKYQCETGPDMGVKYNVLFSPVA